MNNYFMVPKGKTIRDPVHGDIFIPNEFLQIIDTPEFQRLRRIHQLSVAYMAFPGADHTRFSHSIGTFYIMRKIINHFTPILHDMNLSINEREINLALAAALLHDVGHGPFSHSFETSLPNKNGSHEDWTAKIITSKDSQINKVLVQNFGDDFPKDVADLIKKNRQAKHKSFGEEESETIDLSFIISSLISSQIDADRMDYLLRDSYYTGVSLGRIDISRIISSMMITVYKDKFCVCILEKYLSDIEEYLLTRYQMYREIYYHDFKCEMEIIIKKIFSRVLELYNKNLLSDNDFPKWLLKILQGKEISVNEYCLLDDAVLLDLFDKYKFSSDKILSELCCSLLDRKKFKKLKLMNNKKSDIEEFKLSLKNIFDNYGHKLTDFNNEYFWLEDTEDYKVYNPNKDNILILKSDGTVNDLSQISKIISKGTDNSNTTILSGVKNMAYINYDIIKLTDGTSNAEDMVKDIKKLTEQYANRNHIEIEKKYFFEDKKVFDRVIEVLKEKNEYQIDDSEGVKQQTDYYYDTKEKDLLNSNCTLRIRNKNGSYILNVKTPAVKNSDELGTINKDIQSERFEYEKKVEDNDVHKNKNYILKYIPQLDNPSKWDQLENSLIILNNRRKIILSKNNVKFEMVFDDVEYICGSNKAYDYQIEIELKSDYSNRVNLKMLSDYLESQIAGLKPLLQSKYKRGLSLIEK